MSGSVPVLRQTETIKPAPVVSMQGPTGASALATAFQGLQQTLTQGATEVFKQEQERQLGEDRRDALTRPLRDAEGNFIIPEERDWGTTRGRAFNEAILGRLADEANMDAVSRASTIRAQAGGDPVQFSAAWTAYSEQRVRQMPAWVQQHALPAFVRAGIQNTNSMRLDITQREESNQRTAWQGRRDQLEGELETLARAGRVGGDPDYDRLSTEFNAHLDRGVATRFIAPEAATLMRTGLSERVGGQALVRNALGQMASGDTREQVLQRFDQEAERQQVPLAQRERYRNLVESRLAERQAIRSEGRAELQTSAADWETRLTGGVPVRPEEGEALAVQADQAGAPRLAASIRQSQAVYADLRDAAATSLPQMQARQNALMARIQANPETSAREVRLAELLGRAITARREGMVRDPLGTAARAHAQNPDVGELRPLDFSNAETLASGLSARAGQARRLGALEGVRAMPVLTQAEGAQLAGVITNGTRDQQLGLLRSFQGLGADTFRRTMEGLLPGNENERDPRVLTFIGAAGMLARGQENVAREAISGMERLRAMPAPALDAPAVNEFIERRVGQAYAGNPAALAAVRATARAVYAERAGTGQDLSDPAAGRNTPTLSRSFDSGLMGRVLEQVAPVVRMNGVDLPPPSRTTGVLTQAQFDGEIRELPPEALAGARAGDGRPLTPSILRSNGELRAVGEGRYNVFIAGRPVQGPDNRPFVLDMTRRWDPSVTGDFERRLIGSESGGSAGVTNAQGYVGLYQFGSERLQELGVYTPANGEGRNGWRGTFNIPGYPQVRTVEDFRSNPAAQRAAFQTHIAQIDSAIATSGPAARFDRNGLRGVAHLGGVQGMQRWIAAGGPNNGTYDPADANGTTLTAYYNRFSAGAR